MASQHILTKYKTNLPLSPTSSENVGDSKIQHHQSTIHLCNSTSHNTIRDELMNFDNLRANVTEKLKIDNWIIVTSYQNVYVFNLNKRSNGNLSIKKTISINTDLVVKVFVNDVDGQTNDETIFELQLYRWSQLQNLVDQIHIDHIKANVKCENDIEFDRQVVAVLNDDYENIVIQETDVEPFEFCPTNTAELQKALGSVIVKEEKDDSLLIGKSNTFENSPIKVPHTSPKVEEDSFENICSCSKCGKTFDQHARLLIHMRRHDPNELKLCRVCNVTFTGSISQHMEKHSPKKSLQCHICGSNYKYKRSFQDHMKSKHFIGEFYCDICNDGTNHKTKGMIRQHMTRKHNNPTKQYEVPVNIENFQKEFVRKHEDKILGLNTESTNGEKDTSLICPTCGKEYATKRHLSLHMKRHDSSRWKVCKICDKSFPDGLSRHMNSHYKVKQHVCEMCGSAYSQASSLKEHMLINHSPAGEFYCDICKNGRKYLSRLSLKKHLLLHVTRVEKRRRYARKDSFQCKVCKVQCTSWYTLKSHTTLKHNDGSEASIYRCKFCDKEFRMRSSCTVHEKLHFGNTFTCHVCGQSFKHPNYLRKHLKIHKRDESHKKKCTMCDKSYVNNVDLRLHLKKVHGVDVKAGENINTKV